MATGLLLEQATDLQQIRVVQKEIIRLVETLQLIPMKTSGAGIKGLTLLLMMFQKSMDLYEVMLVVVLQLTHTVRMYKIFMERQVILT